jgi:hypothetical protein
LIGGASVFAAAFMIAQKVEAQKVA